MTKELIPSPKCKSSISLTNVNLFICPQIKIINQVRFFITKMASVLLIWWELGKQNFKKWAKIICNTFDILAVWCALLILKKEPGSWNYPVLIFFIKNVESSIYYIRSSAQLVQRILNEYKLMKADDTKRIYKLIIYYQYFLIPF